VQVHAARLAKLREDSPKIQVRTYLLALAIYQNIGNLFFEATNTDV